MRSEALKDFIADIIFPNRCPFCDGFIRWEQLCCGDCYNKIEWLDGHAYEYTAAAIYTGVIKEAVIKLKYSAELNFVKIIAGEIFSRLCDVGLSEGINYVIPVPMGKKKQKKVGYNHSELIADELAKLLGIEKRTDCIFKHDSEKEQHTMNAAERAENVKGQYYIPLPHKGLTKGEMLKGKTVLLCDDVITTGATLNECARLLQEEGADRVILAAAAAAIHNE
ncbi:MAG: hypothetical protein FWG90_10940 [Oscillospiraceae bacterium]|nr:hypothetical protein [Oscillospiraceae bacterium]